MTQDKFIHDSETVLKFIQFYCDNKHLDIGKEDGKFKLVYKDKDLNQDLCYQLCQECKHSLHYSYVKLQECPQVEKPSCRKCKEPCYEKKEWKNSAKIMKFSGMRMGLIKIGTMFKKNK